MATKERCHICGRKVKEGIECKVCHATIDETIKYGFHGNHIANALVTPFVNVYMTNKRFLVFENMSGVGTTTAGGGLVGALIGAAADKMIEKNLGSNGSLKFSANFADIQDVSLEVDKKKGLLLVIDMGEKKPLKYTLDTDFTGTGIDVSQFCEILQGVIS